MPEPQQDARLAALAAFLQKAPALAGIRPIWVDNLPAQPFSGGLFPGGRQPDSSSTSTISLAAWKSSWYTQSNSETICPTTTTGIRYLFRISMWRRVMAPAM